MRSFGHVQNQYSGKRTTAVDNSEQPREPELSSFLAAKPNASSVDFVVNSIKELLLNKKVMPGDRLPAETELTRLLSVSRGSVREAMKILSALGIVEIKRGDGTYISNRGGEVVFDPLLFSLIVSQPKFGEIKELRLILEKNVVRLAIRNAAEEEIKRLRNCFESMQALNSKEKKNYEELLAYDLEFHTILGQACKNGPLETLYKFVMQYFESYIAQSLHKQSDFSRDSIEAHKNILLAVEQRNAPAAEQAVEESLEIWEFLVLKQ
jgi:GntR family transcriptional regulator, transcriptional repressor for pyruvate dehydrogenase complex